MVVLHRKTTVVICHRINYNIPVGLKEIIPVFFRCDDMWTGRHCESGNSEAERKCTFTDSPNLKWRTYLKCPLFLNILYSMKNEIVNTTNVDILVD